MVHRGLGWELLVLGMLEGRWYPHIRMSLGSYSGWLGNNPKRDMGRLLKLMVPAYPGYEINGDGNGIGEHGSAVPSAH